MNSTDTRTYIFARGEYVSEVMHTIKGEQFAPSSILLLLSLLNQLSHTGSTRPSHFTVHPEVTHNNGVAQIKINPVST